MKNYFNKNMISRVFTLFFTIIFIMSLFVSINVSALSSFELESVSITDKSEGVIGTIERHDSDSIESDITFYKINDYVTFKIILKNNQEKEITVSSITDNSNNDYIVYNYDKHENEKINSGENIVLNITATYKKELVDSPNRKQDNNLKFTINYLENDEVKSETIFINPKTGDNIKGNIILLIISSVGLIICIFINKKKKISKIVCYALLGVILTPVVANAASDNYNIEFKSRITLSDKVVITYENDGQESKIVTNYNVPVTGLEVPNKQGYKFVKWTYENGDDFDPTQPISVDTKIVPNYIRIVAIPENRTKDNLQLGDEICINGETIECFNFLKYDENDDAVMLAKWNLNVGNRAKGKETFLQDSAVRGNVKPGKLVNYGEVPFSATNYWTSTLIVSNIYDTSYSTAPDFSTTCNNTDNCYKTPGYSIAYYVEQYKTKLINDYKAPIKDARLLYYSEAMDSSLGYDQDEGYPTNGNSAFITNTKFWLGSAKYSSEVWRYAGIYIGSDYYDGRNFYTNGVRPVIIISKSNL